MPRENTYRSARRGYIKNDEIATNMSCHLKEISPESDINSIVSREVKYLVNQADYERTL